MPVRKPRTRVWRSIQVLRCRGEIWSQRFLTLLALGLLLGAAHPATCGAPLQPDKGRDFAFIVASDTHVGAEDLQANPPVTYKQSLERITRNLDLMRSLVGQRPPIRLGDEAVGPIPVPLGFFILGDLTDGHRETVRQAEQWRNFEALLPAAGIRVGDAPIRVFAMPGNHDGAPAGATRCGLVERNRALYEERHLAALSSNGVHFAVHWQGVHLVGLGLCAADTTDTEAPFKYGQPGVRSWNDPEGAFSFLKDYLEKSVGHSGDPVILMQHYGFDDFSVNDWNWWTLRQRRALYELLGPYNVAAILHGHNHHPEHYRWPDPKSHASELAGYFEGAPPASPRAYDVLSCGEVCWVIRVCGGRLIATHYGSSGWSSERFLVKELGP